ncbi:acyl-CoA dehydrogenase family protein [Nocardia cyriacigeorgica]|uniref:acyl-CoA dehydrogenase family protein n=1 Tax=Nocardia cyriacigeorgica TaxID=135487 RepID=UPI002457C058|nr:acyl-CoA dehydrogenase family protein [Nocardia cyriacigeorgica]
MSTADLLYSDTEQALRDSVRRLLADRCPPDAVMSVYDSAPTDFTPVWKTLAADLGVAGLLVPEELGGAGATAREAAVVLEEIGRAVAPVPFLSSGVLATVALLRAGDTETVRELAEGNRTAALAVPLSTVPHAAVTGVLAADGGLTGTVTSVADALDADLLVVPATGPEGLELHIVDRQACGLTVTPVPALDMTRPLADIFFGATPSTRVSADAAEAVAEALRCGAALLASEQYGVARWCFDTTLAYVKERKQFGRAIGSYQAIKHRLAELWLELGAAASAARYAADTYARGDDDAGIAAALAQSYCGDAAVHAAEECVQLHGGIGMTWEYPAHLYLKRAKSSQLAFGTGYRHRARLAELIDLPVTAEPTTRS